MRAVRSLGPQPEGFETLLDWLRESDLGQFPVAAGEFIEDQFPPQVVLSLGD